MSPLAQLGVLGGTFDPPHRMHLTLAAAARDQLSLDRVMFVPAGDPWRKAGRPLTPAEDRLALTRFAVTDERSLVASDLEVRRDGPTYTLDTLRALAAQGWEAVWFIVGSDALLDLPNWHDPTALIAAARLAVATRPGAAVSDGELDALVPGLGARVDWIPLDADPLSATDLRARIGAGEDVSGDVPAAAGEYARRRRLYER